ncbi:TM0106 family RecB-like putative nuclease [Epidermidibacterium keratini]|uniref:TM0106 family RecB-like putative nuclease n=1 Tax=Epidermidibacterium keratini TaxID=1891644 RepID=A0A7L4YL91_9ACTN|nr:TM0106 family RecB-like putative nuclease [Epidermidibacterium keratini]QHB99889.1 TM0106 family RecB-like putative nuclease [Epidermidibacterium keratini]
MDVADGRVVYSPADLSTYADCAYRALRRLDVATGRVRAPAAAGDALRDRIRERAREHELFVLDGYRERYGDGVLSLDGAPNVPHRAALTQRTLEALASGAEVIHRPHLASGQLYAVADFLVRYGDRWQLVESRFAHRVKTSGRIEIGALAQLLIALEVPIEVDALVHLGNRTSVAVPIIEVLPEAGMVRADFEADLAAALADGPVAWGTPGLRICGWCAPCREAAYLARDVRTVAGLRMEDRAPLLGAGISTIDQLAAADGAVDGLDPQRLSDLRAQARLQVRALPPGAERDPSLAGAVAFEVADAAPIEQLPRASEGDLFFDFESDPLWRASDDDSIDGLEYLFGLWVPARTDEEFVSFWAHNRAEERRALIRFMQFVEAAIARDPALHIYHYSSYEPTVLARVAQRHDTAVDQVAQLIDGGFFVDLLPVVRGSLRTSQDGFGLKKIEPLYMGDEARDGTVQTAAASVVGYQDYVELRDAGRLSEAAAVLAGIEDYNRYDCLSTYRLRNWLLSLVDLPSR